MVITYFWLNLFRNTGIPNLEMHKKVADSEVSFWLLLLFILFYSIAY